MNIFYAPPEQISDHRIELLEQEAHHASRVLRYNEGEAITVVDGRGNWYEGSILRINRNSVLIDIEDHKTKENQVKNLVLGLSIIKNRNRLEFAVEKAVELGASEIVLYQSINTEKSKVRTNRLESIVLSAMKQSLRAKLPAIKRLHSLEELMMEYPDFQYLIAHEKKEGESGVPNEYKSRDDIMLLVGPEGGFTDNEIEMVKGRGGDVISLGSNRLRAETAAITFLSQFI